MPVFGPVPSRRFGRSLGINNIPPKTCTYSCIYCQLGRTTHMPVERTPFYSPNELIGEARAAIAKMEGQGESIDYLTFVPDGEPTLDANLGKAIALAKATGYKVAVITNGSLLWDPSVRDDLSAADAVSVKIDAVDSSIWRAIDRPHRRLGIDEILSGIQDFATEYAGTLLTETMLVQGVNDSSASVGGVADFIGGIGADAAYLSIPIRPPAESRAVPPDETTVARAYGIFSERITRVELLIGYEGTAFSSTGNAREDLLSITAVHPMREDAVRRLIGDAGESWGLVDQLVSSGKLVETTYRGERHYLRKFPAKMRGNR